MADDLLSEFSNLSSGHQNQNLAIEVERYIFVGDGPESPQNARIVGRRWDTGEKVEVALRPIKSEAERPGIRNFQDDSASATPVTTGTGGTVIVEGAYQDNTLQPLGGNALPVFNGRWITRIAEHSGVGFAICVTARVNAPRYFNPDRPADGLYQNISVMADHEAVSVSSLDELDSAVVEALDTQARDRSPNWHLRPGAVCAYVRMRAGDESALYTLYGGFHTPPGAQYSIPKTRDLIAQDLKGDVAWRKRRDMLLNALDNPNYTVEVIPGSSLYVGRKSIAHKQSRRQSRIEGASMPGPDGHDVALFTKMVIGLRRSPKTGQLQAIWAKPQQLGQAASRTGILMSSQKSEPVAESQPTLARSPLAANPSQNDRVPDQVPSATGKPAPVVGSESGNANSAPTPAPQPEAKPEPAPGLTAEQTPESVADQPAARFLPLDIVRLSNLPGTLRVQAKSPRQLALLRELVAGNIGLLDEPSRSFTLSETKLLDLVSHAQSRGFTLNVIAGEPEAIAEVAPETAAPHQAQAPASPQPPIPQESAPSLTANADASSTTVNTMTEPVSSESVIPSVATSVANPAPTALTTAPVQKLAEQSSVPLDLSDLDFSSLDGPDPLAHLDFDSLDLDASLQQAYSEYTESSTPRRSM